MDICPDDISGGWTFHLMYHFYNTITNMMTNYDFPALYFPPQLQTLLVSLILVFVFHLEANFRVRTANQQRIRSLLSIFSLPICMSFVFYTFNDYYFEILRLLVYYVNVSRLIVLSIAFAIQLNLYSPETFCYLGQVRKVFEKIILSSQIYITLYLFCVYFPIKLTNAYMHSLNGNIVDKIEPQGDIYVSSIDERGNQRSHTIADSTFKWIPPVEVNHNFKWKTGDKIIDSVYSFFRGTPQEKVYSESFKTCEEGKSSVAEFLSNPTTIIILFIAVMLLFIHVPGKLTKSLVVVVIGVILSLKVTGLFDKFDSVGLLDIWYKLPQYDEDLEMDNIEPQGFVDYVPIFSSVLLVSISALSGYNAKKSFLNGLIQATKVTDVQTGNVTTAMFSMCSRVYDFLKSLSQDSVAEYFDVEKSIDTKVKNLQTKVFKFCSSFNSGSPDSMLHCLDVYKNLYDESKELLNSVPKNSYDYKIVFDSTTKLLTVYQKILDMEVSLSGERVEPVCIFLHGTPGVMKGVLLKRLAKVCAIATLPKEWRESYKQDNREFFFNVPTDSFWDTYTNKAWVTVYDDIFQRRDAVADSDSDALKIIKMVNSAPFNLKMAGVSQKNNTFFRSAFVFCTSNVSDFTKIQSLSDFKAAERRMHLMINVKIHKKYLDVHGNLDKTLLPNDFDEEGKNIPNDFWHLSITEHVGNQQLKPKVVDLKGLVKAIVERYQKHKMNYFVNRKSENNLINQLSQELGFDWEEEEEVIVPQGGLNDYDTSFLEPLSFHSDHTRAIYEAEYFKICDNIGRLDLYGDGFYKAMKIYCEYCDHYELNKLIDNKTAFFVELERQFRLSIQMQRHPLTLKPEWHKDFERPEQGPLTRLKSIYFAFKEFISENLVMVLAASLFSAAAIYYLSGFFTTVISSQSVDYKTMGKHKSGKKQIKLSVKGKDFKILEAQSGIPFDFDFDGLPKFKSTDFGPRNNQNDVVSKIFNKYFYIMYLYEHNDQAITRFGHVTNLLGQIYLVPFHFMFLLDIVVKSDSYKGATIILTTSSGSNRYAVSLEEFVNSFKTTEEAADNDVCLVKLKCAQKFSKGALSNYLKISDYENLSRMNSFNAELLGSYHLENNSGISLRSKSVRAHSMGGGISVNATWSGQEYEYNLFNTFIYNTKTSKGDCGSLLIASDSNYENRFVLGMHSAGGSRDGYSVRILQEPLKEMIDNLFPDEQYFLEEEKPDYLEETGLLEPQSGLPVIFDIKKPYTFTDMSKSNIAKSKLHGKLPGYEKVGTRPARLREFVTEEGEVIDPLGMAFEKYGKRPPDISMEQVDQAIESYESLLHEHFKSIPSKRRVLTLKEALHTYGRMNSINSSTSSGFPMNLPCEDDLKKEYYDAYNSGDAVKTEEAFQRIANLVESVLQKYREKIRPFYAYKQCGKDEPRSLAKFLLFLTRLFSACPFILLILFRMYFGDFISDFIEANVDIGSAVGVNPYSHDWDSIARRILQFSDNEFEESVAAGDQGEFDTRQWTAIHNRVSDMIGRFYPNATEEEKYIRAALYMEITNSRHVFRNKVYMWFSGLPSGNPMTAILNTIYNHITFRICWIVADLPIKKFNKKVYLIVLGDDNSFSVAFEYREAFNEMTLVDLMSQIGMKYTTEIKTVSVKPFRRIMDVEFLKRGFRKDYSLNRWVAPLRLEAIFEMLNWTKKGKEGSQITLDNINFALRELCLHSREIFEKWVIIFRELKSVLFPGQTSHGDMPCHYGNTYVEVLKEEYYF